MNRTEFQRLARDRLGDAEVLLAADRFDCAYYVAGYAVECALKACIANLTREDDFPPRKTDKIWTHDLDDLVDSANLGSELSRLIRADESFEASWLIVKDWSESSRYDTGKGRVQVEMIVGAIRNPENGILQWLQKHW